jgi:hypothetical protein
MLKTKKVLGEVSFNNGDFCEIDTYGLEGIDTGLMLESIQLARHDTGDGVKKFRQRFRIGTLLDITTITTITVSSKTERDLKELGRACDEVQKSFIKSLKGLS